MFNVSELHNIQTDMKERLNNLLSFDDIDDTLKEEIPRLISNIKKIEEELQWIESQAG